MNLHRRNLAERQSRELHAVLTVLPCASRLDRPRWPSWARSSWASSAASGAWIRSGAVVGAATLASRPTRSLSARHGPQPLNAHRHVSRIDAPRRASCSSPDSGDGRWRVPAAGAAATRAGDRRESTSERPEHDGYAAGCCLSTQTIAADAWSATQTTAQPSTSECHVAMRHDSRPSRRSRPLRSLSRLTIQSRPNPPSRPPEPRDPDESRGPMPRTATRRPRAGSRRARVMRAPRSCSSRCARGARLGHSWAGGPGLVTGSLGERVDPRRAPVPACLTCDPRARRWRSTTMNDSPVDLSDGTPSSRCRR